MMAHVPSNEYVKQTGARLTKAQFKDNLQAKIKDSEMHILRCMGPNLYAKF